jgi:hypothetical protein
MTEKLPMKQRWLGILAATAANPANSQFVTVDFVKKDGTPRTVTFNPAAIKSKLKGAEASESAQRAAVTRKENHPDLINVIDVHKTKKEGKPAFVCFSWKNVTRLKHKGVEFFAT